MMTTNPTGKSVKKTPVKKTPTVKKTPSTKKLGNTALIPGMGMTTVSGYENMSAKKGVTIKKAAPKAQNGKLTKKELDALSHQKRGMGELSNSYVKKSGSIMNDIGYLTNSQKEQLKNYMSKAGTAKKIYEALPNLGRMLGHGNSAADIPKGSQLEKQRKGGVVKKKMKNGGSLSGLKASAKRVGPVDPKGAYTKVQKKTLKGAKGKASLTKDKQLGATKMAKRGMSVKKK